MRKLDRRGSTPSRSRDRGRRRRKPGQARAGRCNGSGHPVDDAGAGSGIAPLAQPLESTGQRLEAGGGGLAPFKISSSESSVRSSRGRSFSSAVWIGVRALVSGRCPRAASGRDERTSAHSRRRVVAGS